MDHLDVPQFLGLLVAILIGAKIGGALARLIGQPSVLGELLAGLVLGTSVLGLMGTHEKSANSEMVHLLAELGVIILLFEIGLETDLRKLLKVGSASLAVALVGVAAPFALGYAACWWLGLPTLVSIFIGASLTATSVGITARVLSDLGRLQDPEGQIILGAAIIDDVVGLVILAVVTGMSEGKEPTVLSIASTAGLAFGFLLVTLLVGRFLVPGLSLLLRKVDLPGSTTILSLSVALGLAWLAHQSGSALIIGAFAAGLLLRESSHSEEIEHGVAALGHFFVPIFFVSVGAAIDVSTFSPFREGSTATLRLGGLLVLGAIAGKFVAGYAPFWYRANKQVIGVGMIPRGEVGLIFAQLGLDRDVFTTSQFSAVALMVIVTTFIAPPLLKWLLPARHGVPWEIQGIEDLVAGPRDEEEHSRQ